jgi:serine/threonine protein kinase
MIGKTIFHYKVLEKLGEGGMGVVYKAQDTKLKRPVALKFLSQGSTYDSNAVERFMNESQTASALDHANICTIYDINETKGGSFLLRWRTMRVKKFFSQHHVYQTESV